MTVIGVVGAGSCDEKIDRLAHRVGELIAKRGAAMVCGGLGGVMEAASRGAAENGGVTIGVLPGGGREDANPYINLPLVTDMGHARNVIIAHTAQALIAISGGYGSLSEISIGLKLGKPVI
ncbi:MAG: TIGR00725 family protein, partial [Nitrospinota bacterium]|nr:TIGR00725 family protein [Nitrospinota bacterium]